MRKIAAAVMLAASTAACATLLGKQPGHPWSVTRRLSALRRAQVWSPTNVSAVDIVAGPPAPDGFAPSATVRCEYVDKPLGGSSPKFACAVAPHDEVKVKYGSDNGEVYGEVAATRLLWALGFPVDRMYPVQVICHDCPGRLGGSKIDDSTYEFDVAAIERKLPGRAVALENREGWTWPELDQISEAEGGAPKAHRDALKLLAAMLQHTDSKSEQQRLLCLAHERETSKGDEPEKSHHKRSAKARKEERTEERKEEGKEERKKERKRERDESCERPVAMINDLGLTFGRANAFNRESVGSVNLEEWARTPVWTDSKQCVANIWRSTTGTLDHPRISEAGREFLAGLLTQLTDRQIRDLFEVSRFDRPRASPPGSGGIDAWIAAFKAKRDQVVTRKCEN